MAFQGQVIDGKYEILREIGRGGMSVVYLAMDKRLNKQWAIKEFRKDKDDESRRIALESLLKEANLMKKLDHPTLPRIVDIIDDTKTVYIVMDYIEGESLNKVLDAYGAQPQEAVIEWAKQLSEVLDYLHTRVPPVIYRDMKPANIMLKPDGTIRLIDFGIAREYKKGKAGDTTSIGTRGYAAPEQFGDKGQTDARTDIYSLGVTLYHLVTGKNPAEPPYEIYPIRHWNANLSSGLEWLIQKCTQLNPNDRFQSCAEVTYVLENLEKFESAYKSKQKKKINLFITSVALTLVFGIIGGTTLFLGNSDESEQISYYRNLDTVSGYMYVIDHYSNNYDACAESYDKLISKLSKDVKTILPGKRSDDNAEKTDEEKIYEITDEYLDNDGVIYQDDINKCFDSRKIEIFREKYKDTYVKINYTLGNLYWNCYKSGSNADEQKNSDSQAEKQAMKYARPYFNNVIEVATDDAAHCGLDDSQYCQANYYYLLSYFREQEDRLKNAVANENIVKGTNVEKTIIYKMLEENLSKGNYYIYWSVNVQMITNFDNMDFTLFDRAKLNTLQIILNTVYRNFEDFINPGKANMVPAEESQAFFNAAVDQFNKISESFNGGKNNDEVRRQLDNTKDLLLDLRIKFSDNYLKYQQKTIKLKDIE